MAGGLAIALPGKFFGVAAAMVALWYLARRYFESDEIQQWLWETWRFVRQIFPLLIVGVFAVGVIRQLIRPEWIEALAGSNTLLGNLAGVVFGVFMYFPTLVEVPIAKMFLSLGMHRGPLLAYLMADPELSLQSILITGHHHRQAQGLGLCGLGGALQHRGRAALRRLEGWDEPVADRALPGDLCRGAGRGAHVPEPAQPSDRGAGQGLTR